MKTFRNILIIVSLGLPLFQFAGDDSFNCHNYAWESSKRWLEDPTSYIKSAKQCGPKDATRVVYYKGETPIHSGIYLGHGWVKSKWGSNPVMVHPVFLSIYGFNVKYYQ